MISTDNSRTVRAGAGFRVLGVDPAVAGATGYGIVEFHGSRARLLRFGALKLPARATLASRLRAIHELIAQLAGEYCPDAIAIESVFSALNAGTALKLAEVRGVILLAAAQAQIPAHNYSPREVKSSVAGYGAASKQQMQQMVASLLGLRENPQPADAADALAVALCHAHHSQTLERMTAAMSAGAAQAALRSAGRTPQPAPGKRMHPARIPVSR